MSIRFPSHSGALGPYEWQLGKRKEEQTALCNSEKQAKGGQEHGLRSDGDRGKLLAFSGFSCSKLF